MVTVSQGSSTLAIRDVRDGIGSVYLWSMLAWQEIKQRYRRSTLGPFWLTISYGAMIGGMGPLYGKLLQQDISAYFPYLAVSFVTWIFLSGIVNDACSAFIGAEGFIKQVKLPLTVHVMRVVWKQVLILAHNFVIVPLVMIFYPTHVTWELLLVPFGVLMIAVNGIWLGVLLGLLCARFRDISQIVASVVQIAFFMTPVMWRSDLLGRKAWIVEINPFYHFLEIVRAPLLGTGIPWHSWLVVFCITAAGFALTLPVFARYRARVAYWV